MRRQSKLSDLCISITDCPHSTPKWTADGVVVLRNQNIRNGRLDLTSPSFTDEAHFQERIRRAEPTTNDIVITREAPMGEVCLIPEGLRCCLGQRMVLLRPDPTEVDARYLLYALQSNEVQHEIRVSEGTGSTVSNLRIPILKALPIPIVELGEQRRIAHVLGTLDDKIELNRKMNETLEEIARTLFTSWFVNFDPVKAKAAGEKPFGMDEATAALFPDSFVDSELGPIPSGWEVKRLADLCTTQYGFTASATADPVGPHFLRVMDINKRNWIEWNSVPYCEIPEKEKQKYSLRLGDIVVARMADPGKSAIIEDDEVDAVFASYLVRLTSQDLASSYFLYGFLKSAAYEDYAAGAKSGSVQANMNAKVIVGAKLVVPSELLMESWLNVVRPLRLKIVANVNESRTLAEIRDTLLPKLLSGEMRVRESERVAEGIST